MTGESTYKNMCTDLWFSECFTDRNILYNREYVSDVWNKRVVVG